MWHLFDEVDQRLREQLLSDFDRRRLLKHESIARLTTIVLAGHRAAGKSRLLPHIAKILQRQAIDLDAEIERRSQRRLFEWVQNDEPSFRAAERQCFESLRPGLVVAVGGGFLSHHTDALVHCLVVQIPVTLETYVERLLADTTRPRLRQNVTLNIELRQIYHERENIHRSVSTTSLAEFLVRVERGQRPSRVVTLPPHADSIAFANRARKDGADLLEVRSDLTPHSIDLSPLQSILPLLVSERTESVPEAWIRSAMLVDRPLEKYTEAPFLSFHAPTPMTTDEAVRAWQHVRPGILIKHIEPLGDISTAARLFDTRRALANRFGTDAVTVLPMGELALPFRAIMARQNAMDYVAADSLWAAASGQLLLLDAVREYRRPGANPKTHRLGILGHDIAHSRSPRIHRAPFDRIDLPSNVDLAPLLTALRPHYVGFAVTSPFKQAVAQAIFAPREAVNTLVRTADGWSGFNADVEGAKAVFDVLRAREVTVLGDGGVADALREAAGSDVTLRFVRRDDAETVSGTAIYTWPASIDMPNKLRFVDARVAIIAYGSGARQIAEQIKNRGGEPIFLGPKWFVAQARRQRQLWEQGI